jgi:hypothetical protein
MVTEHFEFAGWTDNLRLANDQVEVVILREVDPRIISLRPLNGRNGFKIVAEQSGKSGEGTWQIRGGHRLWTAPEDYGDPNGLTYVLETFTNEEFLELESLGPYQEVSPGQTVKHTEVWAVFSGLQLPPIQDEDALARAIDPYLKQLL